MRIGTVEQFIKACPTDKVGHYDDYGYSWDLDPQTLETLKSNTVIDFDVKTQLSDMGITPVLMLVIGLDSVKKPRPWITCPCDNVGRCLSATDLIVKVNTFNWINRIEFYQTVTNNKSGSYYIKKIGFDLVEFDDFNKMLITNPTANDAETEVIMGNPTIRPLNRDRITIDMMLREFIDIDSFSINDSVLTIIKQFAF